MRLVPAVLVSWLMAFIAAATVTAGAAHAARPTLPATAYRAKANALCTGFTKYSPPATDTQIEQLTALLKRARAAAASLSRLRPPSSLAHLHAQVIKLLNEGYDFYAAKLAQVKAGKLTVTQFTDDLERTTYGTKEDALWKRLGATACVKP